MISGHLFGRQFCVQFSGLGVFAILLFLASFWRIRMCLGDDDDDDDDLWWMQVVNVSVAEYINNDDDDDARQLAWVARRGVSASSGGGPRARAPVVVDGRHGLRLRRRPEVLCTRHGRRATHLLPALHQRVADQDRAAGARRAAGEGAREAAAGAGRPGRCRRRRSTR